MGIIKLDKAPMLDKAPPVTVDAVKSKDQDTKDEDTSPEDKDDGKERVVVMDGPLSHIYTAALNLAYAKEDTGTMGMKIVRYGDMVNDAVSGSSSLVDASGTYVYAIDDTSLDSQGLVSVLEGLRDVIKGGKYDRVILAIEARVVSSKMQLLDTASGEMGVIVKLNRSSAVHTVLSGVRV